MEKLVVRGGPDFRLTGRVRISGAKNAVLPAIAACLLTAEEVRLENVPLVKDVHTMLTLIEGLGGTCRLEGNTLTVRVADIRSDEASYELVRAMRASILVLGPLLARFGRAVVALPGGCAIGSRPVDLHIAGLQKLGASISLEHGNIRARAGRLRGGEIEFEKKTVTGTENLLMAAALAKGETILKNCAREPEVTDLAALLNKMGARIDWVDEDTARVRGVKSLGGAAHDIIPDRIETGTFLVAGALTAGDILLDEVVPAHAAAVIEKLRASGTAVEPEGERGLRVVGGPEVKPQDITTSPYPGFPTDMQAQFMVLLTQAPGHVHSHRDHLRPPLLPRQRARPARGRDRGPGRQGRRQRARPPCPGPRSWPPTCGPRRPSSWPGSSPRARPSSARSSTSTAATNGSRTSSGRSGPRSKGSRHERPGPERSAFSAGSSARSSRPPILFENDRVLAFEDIRPRAPVHVLVIPKAHFASLNEAPEGSEDLLGEILSTAREIARQKGIDGSGYRIVLNTGPHSGQEVFHIHFHVLGGRPMSWPPG
jgi:UDP-N-acetylglucosamine 1-carboxyvinyltransferase